MIEHPEAKQQARKRAAGQGSDWHENVTEKSDWGAAQAELEKDRERKKLERASSAKVLGNFGRSIKEHGFVRKGRSMRFARDRGHFAHFISFHKFTFGPCFRMEYGVRVLNDPREHIVLNGPDVTEHLDYSTDAAAIEACANVMMRYVLDDGLAWFEAQTPANLLGEKSCLDPEARIALQQAIDGNADFTAVAQSRKLLGFADS